MIKRIASRARTLVVACKVRIVKTFVVVRKFIVSIPSYLKSRPKAIKAYFAERKKQKIYHSFKLEKKIKLSNKPIPTSWALTKESFRFFTQNFWIFFWMICIHAGLYGALVYGPTDINVSEIQDTLKAAFGTNPNSLEGTAVAVGSLIGASTQRQGAAFYNFLIVLLMSLSLVWVIRHLLAKQRFTIRDGFYNGPRPAIPVVLLLFVMMIQALPFTIASYVYVIGRTSGTFITGWEDLTFFLIALFCGLFSLYLMTPAIMSLYAVTLPNMYPLKTLRMSKQIVQFRRFEVFRRIFALPFIVALLFFAILLILLRLYPEGGIWFVRIFPIVILPMIHIYLFKLYKSLL